MTVLFDGASVVKIGPTWRRLPDDSAWELPEWTLGWGILRWIEKYLLGDDGLPFVPTSEQARFILWWYAVDDRGRFVYRDGVLQRLKGWGKDPLAAVLAIVEFLGPCRFGGWAEEKNEASELKAGDPYGVDHPQAWISIVGTSLSNTRNTMLLVAGMFSRELRDLHGMTKADFGKQRIYAYGGVRQIETVPLSATNIEGNRPTLVILGEVHLWTDSNGGIEVYETIDRNTAKSKGGLSRSLAITNAYDPSMGSVGQVVREAWENEQAGLAIDTGVLYDSLEAPKGTPLLPPGIEDPTDDEVRAWVASVVDAVRGDAWWLSTERIVNSILSGTMKPSISRRFYYNSIVNAEDAWLKYEAVALSADPLAVEARLTGDDALRAGWLVRPDEPVALFFDGSLSDDATALVGVRISDGFTMTLGVWQRPAGALGKTWRVPRHEVSHRVDEVMERFHVYAFWGDPSHALDTEGVRFWDPIMDAWHRKYRDDLKLWSVKTGDRQHSIMWDMAAPERTALFTGSAEQVVGELEQDPPAFMHDGHPALIKHLQNARRTVNKHGVSLWKGGRESPNKIDLAVCLVGAHMLRRLVLNGPPVETEKSKGGVIW